MHPLSFPVWWKISFYFFSDSLHQCWYVWFNNGTMQEYLEETVGSCTRRMILYQVSDITFLMLLCNSLLTMMYLLNWHMWYVMFSPETLIWVFYTLKTCLAFSSCPIPLGYVILDRSSFVVNLLLCCAYLLEYINIFVFVQYPSIVGFMWFWLGHLLLWFFLNRSFVVNIWFCVLHTPL